MLFCVVDVEDGYFRVLEFSGVLTDFWVNRKRFVEVLCFPSEPRLPYLLARFAKTVNKV